MVLCLTHNLQNDMVQGFVVYSRIDNFQGREVAACPNRTIYTEDDMYCAAWSPQHGKQFVTPVVCPGVVCHHIPTAAHTLKKLTFTKRH